MATEPWEYTRLNAWLDGEDSYNAPSGPPLTAEQVDATKPLTEACVERMLAEYEASTQGKWTAVETEEPDDPTDPDAEWGWTIHGPRLLELGDYTYNCKADAVFSARAHNQMPRLVADWRRLKRIETAARDVADILRPIGLRDARTDAAILGSRVRALRKALEASDAD